MAFELDFDIKVSPDRKQIWLVDHSKYFESINTLLDAIRIEVKTYFDVFDDMIEEYKNVPFTMSTLTFEEGTVFQINASDINPDGTEYVQDNVYDVVMTMFNDSTIFVSEENTLADFITNEYNAGGVYGEYDYVKIIEVDESEHYYSIPAIAPPGAVEGDFTEVVDVTTDTVVKNNIEGAFPMSRWYLDSIKGTAKVCEILASQERANEIIMKEAIYSALMTNSELGKGDFVQEALIYFYPLYNAQMEA